MPVTLGSNIASLKAQRQLAQGSRTLETVFERLSSGQRINSAADDAAGLAIADSLRADARIYTQAIRNVNDGISVTAIASGALEALGGVATRIKELSIQAMSGSFSAQQRKALDQEAQALASEYRRIIETAKFNGRALFDTQLPNTTLQVGIGAAAQLSHVFGNDLLGIVGTGYFTETGSSVTPGTPGSAIFGRQVELADINGDGNLDALSGYNGWGISNGRTLSWTLGNSDGTFGPFDVQTVGSTTSRAIYLAVGDVDNDGKDDVIVSSETHDDGLRLFRNFNGSNFSVSTIGGGLDLDSSKVNLVDINGDGNLDVVTWSGNNDVLYSFLGNGNGTFGTAN